MSSSNTLFNAHIITIFPEIFPGSLGLSLAGRALNNSIWQLNVVNLRDFGVTKHKNVDDEPFGGGNGLVLRPDVAGEAIEYILKNHPIDQIYYPSPRGKKFTQTVAREISQKKHILILCGRFEGLDERVISHYNVEEISIGDYILSGGELAAQVIIDSCLRLIPGVLDNNETVKEESFDIDGKQLLEYPQYTRPQIWKSEAVPEILLSGHHDKIKKWRKQKALEITQERRPDLLD